MVREHTSCQIVKRRIRSPQKKLIDLTLQMIHNKILLTGASGWFGQSFIAQYAAKFGQGALRQITLVTSDGREIKHPDVPFPLKTVSMHTANALRGHDVIVHAGFPSRDKINTLGHKVYQETCESILTNLRLIIKKNHCADIYLISSGAVYNDTSLYGRYKRHEEEVVKKLISNNYYIFRIFTATTKSMDYRPWSAICNFMKCRLIGQNITIESREELLRGIVCMQDLSDLILRIADKAEASQQKQKTYDAVSHVTSIRKLAILCSANEVSTILPENYDLSKINSEYSGRPEPFQTLAHDFKIELKPPGLQIENCFMTPFQLTFK